MTDLDPLRLHVVVPIGLDEAFDLFTDLAAWWPLRSHSVAGERAETCELEPHEGGAILERADDGTEYRWGTVTTWEPPERLVFDWHPGREADTAQEIEVRFSSEGSGTRVDLEHRGWDAYGEGAAEARADYETGWAFSLGENFAVTAGAREVAPERGPSAGSGERAELDR